ncbi:LysR family transcriptional regulator [Enemella evansiae]|uniref:LysR family transcriptional regulator n=1 Tax=Enemella evansiae TaxID=2016499 RepID=UPI000B968652|nr:LysR family transcriptional regulator [Enemella evansiae]OYO01511.1 LysR family transcriptional regulator [Enemella evansiae]
MGEPTLRQLEYFAAVAASESVSAAARECGVSQAAVSLAVAQLERALDTALVVRRPGHGIVLTEEGRAIGQQARRICDDVAELPTLGRTSEELTGRLVVGIFRANITYIAPDLIEWFHRRHPQVRLEIVEGTATQLQQSALAGHVHVCLVSHVQRMPGLDFEPLVDRYRRVVVSTEHPLAALPRVSYRDLAQHAGALLDLEPALERALAEFARNGEVPDVRWKLTDVASIYELVERGIAYSLLLEPGLPRPADAPLLWLPLAHEEPSNPLVAVWPAGRPPSRLVEELLTCLRTKWAPSPAG